MLYLGLFNELKIDRETSVGLFLVDEEQNDVLLPNRYVPEQYSIGDLINVFLYLDHDERIVATTVKPLIELNTFAYLTCIEVNHLGAFLDCGLMKHFFCPYKQQKEKMQEGKKYIVYLYLDEFTQRLTLSSKYNHFLEKDFCTLKKGDEVDILLAERTNLGIKVIVNDTYQGLLFTNLITKPVQIGEKTKAYVYNIREDNKIDIGLSPEGFEAKLDAKQQILNALAQNDGFLPLNDYSDPDKIREELLMSKKTFKQSIGILYKEKKILILKNGIELIQN